MLGNKQVMSRNIRKYLELKDVTAADLSRAIDVPQPTISTWLSARYYPRIDKIEKMAKYFNCTKADLVEDEEDYSKLIEVTDEQYRLLKAYQSADENTKAMIRKLLDYMEK